ncbi:hypothetical protein AAY473_032522 [Plecturocebus cupreus]
MEESEVTEESASKLILELKSANLSLEFIPLHLLVKRVTPRLEDVPRQGAFELIFCQTSSLLLNYLLWGDTVSDSSVTQAVTCSGTIMAN